MAKENKRLLAVDILRGITIAGMLLVNNPGSSGSIFPPLEHAEWMGLTPTDLVFPFFMFVMGVSMFFSLRKFEFKPSRGLLWKITRRTIVLFLIGWLVSWFSMTLRSFFTPDYDLVGRLWGHLRFLGVFQRLALVYFFGSLIAIFVKQKFIPWVIGLLLVVYAVILGLGNGYEFSQANILSRVDLAVLGDDHMYHEHAYGLTLALDPEGILSTISCVAHVLIGFMVGKMLIDHRDNRERVVRVATLGIGLLLAGWLLQYGIPCGKKAWTPTYTLITTGMASCILALLVYIIDIQGRERWCRFFQSFGVNPLFCYLVGTMLSIAFSVVVLWRSDDYRPADETRAEALLVEAARDGLPEAQNNLALTLLNKKEATAADTVKATRLLRKAERHDLATARLNLALLYLNQGNNAEGLPLLQQAADSCMTQAQLDLALVYDYGLYDQEPDHARARELYGQAAGQGSGRAVMILEQIADKENGLQDVFTVPDDVLMTGLSSCGAIEETDSTSNAVKRFNEALEVGSSSGKSVNFHNLLHNVCKLATGATINDDATVGDALAYGSMEASNPRAASCLFAILFVLLNWMLGYILYRRHIYIKI